MECKGSQNSGKQESLAGLPSLFQSLSSKVVPGFDNIEDNSDIVYQFQTTASSDPPLAKGTEAASFESQPILLPSLMSTSTVPAIDLHLLHSTSISMPTSPSGFRLEQAKRVILADNTIENVNNYGVANSPAKSAIANTQLPKQVKFYSQPIPSGITHAEAVTAQRNLRSEELKDKRYNSFKTWSGKLETRISNLRGQQQEEYPEINDTPNVEIEILPVGRFFDALKGPELDTLKASEELVLPEHKQWPFLLRYPISSFGICLGVGSQAILWKALATSPSMRFLHVSPTINVILWCISISLTAIVSFAYSLKFIFYFEAVRREFHHPIRVNFFFAPWIAFLFLALGVPPVIAKNLHPVLWYLLMAPILCLELKIYGQWMSGGQRRLSKVANPSNHLSIVGNFVGALLGASMGLKEGPIFFFAIGLAHYMVLFVTLYQRLPTNETLPKELHPVFFLFVAAPSVASIAWANIQGDFDIGSKISYFIALFLYFSLAVRVNFFRGFRFSWAWWAYTFPMTGASVATVRYSNKVSNPLTQSLSIVLSAISTLMVTALFISTVFHAIVLRNLFPNDIAIAIAKGRPSISKKRLNLILASSDTQVNKAASLTRSVDV